MFSFVESLFRRGRRSFVGIACLALFTGVPGRSQFEGIIRSRNLSTDETGTPQEYTMVMWVKGGSLRVETSAVGEEPGTLMIYRTDLRCYWIVNHSDHSYIEVRRVSGDSLEDGIQEVKSRKPRLKRTGKTQRLLGYAAVQMTSRDGDLETELWGTHELEPLSRAIAAALGNEAGTAGGSEMTREFASMGMYPLIARIRLDGRVVEESEVTAVDRTRLPDSLFVLPPGYRKQAMEEMFEMPPRQ